MEVKRQLHQLEIDIFIKGPFLSKNSGAMKHGLDASVWRYLDKPAIPGSLISGNIRHALEYFLTVIAEKDINSDSYPLTQKLIDSWFGAGGDGTSNSPDNSGSRKSAIFDHAWVLHDKSETSSRTRISINPETGIVRKGSLIVSESALDTDETGKFSGTVKLVATQNEADCLKFWLTKALAYIPAYGSMKSAGYGRCIHTDVTQPKAFINPPDLIKPINTERGYATYDLAITLDRPFCLAPVRLPDTNRFETLDYLPGNVIKAAMAAFIRSRHRDNAEETLQRCGFDQWHISHANEPGVATIPQSIAFYPLQKDCGKDIVVDTAFCSGAPMVKFNDQLYAPVYASDRKFKHTDTINQTLGIKEPQSRKILSLHTRIEPLANTADDQGLFSQEEIMPFTPDENGIQIDTRYITRLIIPENSRTEAEKLLHEMSTEQLSGIGRTQACATLHWPSDTVSGSTSPLNRSAIEDTAADATAIVITLNSDAELFTDAELATLADNNTTNMNSIYERYWQKVFGNELTLNNLFATQKRAGGEHHWRYYQGGRGKYAPIWLTERGSVFQFNVQQTITDSLIEKLRQMETFGIPPVGEETSAYDTPDNTNRWRRSPYLRQHGYGQVDIHVTQPNQARAWLVSDESITSTDITQLQSETSEGISLKIISVQGVLS